jgi:hypothetical protein
MFLNSLRIHSRYEVVARFFYIPRPLCIFPGSYSRNIRQACVQQLKPHLHNTAVGEAFSKSEVSRFSTNPTASARQPTTDSLNFHLDQQPQFSLQIVGQPRHPVSLSFHPAQIFHSDVSVNACLVKPKTLLKPGLRSPGRLLRRSPVSQQICWTVRVKISNLQLGRKRARVAHDFLPEVCGAWYCICAHDLRFLC